MLEYVRPIIADPKYIHSIFKINNIYNKNGVTCPESHLSVGPKSYLSVVLRYR